MSEGISIPTFSKYGEYSNENYGVHALVFTDIKGNKFYYSYKTLIAFRTIRTGLIVRENIWGNTTGKHLNWIDNGNKKGRVNTEEFYRILKETFNEAEQ